MNQTLRSIFQTKSTEDKSGKVRIIDDCISLTEAGIIYKMIKKSKAVNTIEIGLAHGVSALVFCQALSETGIKNPIHYAVDPNQLTTYGSAALYAVEKAGYGNILKLCSGPSHMELPKLIEKSVILDCAFIDGWHTFDYTLMDFFLIDKMLKSGGYVAFHDGYGRAKQKVVDFILTHRKYELDKELMNFQDDSLKMRIKFFLWRIYKDPMLLFSWFHWKYQTKRTSGLIILKKLENFEPDYSFFKSF
ncbi:MAG: class I SAM-dependent methyltransferase [Saprospiraceae bacterium]